MSRSLQTLVHELPMTSAPDDSEPSAERQAELRAAYDANVAAGRSPYANVSIRSRGELTWILGERGWLGEYDAYTVKYVLKPRGESHEPADLRNANLSHVALCDVYLRLADLSGANLVFADLHGAHLADTNLAHADMGRVNLQGAELNYANLSDAHLREASLEGANLQYAKLNGARLYRADLRSAILHGVQMEPSTIFSDVTLNGSTWLGDVIWNGVSLARVNWDQARRLGDELGIAAAQNPQERTEAYRAAARAYHQLAVALQEQGLGDVASQYAYRAQVLQRKVSWRQRKLGQWLFSLILALLAGYGYRMGRILLAYLVVVGVSSVAYFVLGALGFGPHFAPHEALLVSVTAFHGRVFAEQFRPDMPQAWIAAFEAVMGLVIEGVFIAMLAQRFFGK
jgi:hypothetical protein